MPLLEGRVLIGFQFLLDEDVSPAADQSDSRAVGQPLVTLTLVNGWVVQIFVKSVSVLKSRTRNMLTSIAIAGDLQY
eukprot:402604-Pelagomonas_calceolata.AAC.1